MTTTEVPRSCPLHPRYWAVLPPRSTKPGCVCQEIYEAAHKPIGRTVERAFEPGEGLYPGSA